jgi:hypothetical protein
MKYGWEIADEVQRFASGSADMKFVPATVHEELQNRFDNLKAKLVAQDRIFSKSVVVPTEDYAELTAEHNKLNAKVIFHK